VHFIGKIGQDSFGVSTKTNLEDNCVNISHLYTADDPSVPSGVAPITVDKSGENSTLSLL
jgi:ribokinase